jgi:hypothetical protein
MRRGPGRPRVGDHEIETRVTNAQLLHLRMRAVAANTSAAAVMRALIDKDIEEVEACPTTTPAKRSPKRGAA